MFEYPDINRSVLVTAIDAHQAVLRAVLDQKLPVSFRRDQHGNLQAKYWDTSLKGSSQWPSIYKGNCLVWTDGSQQFRLRFETIEI